MDYHKYCTYNDKKILHGESMYDFDSCAIVFCQQEPSGSCQISHKVLYPNGCCHIDGNMVPEGHFADSQLCHQKQVYKLAQNQSSSENVSTV